MGAGLVLDEFALILHLDDVYWSEAGRKSVEMVVVTAALVGLLLAGFAPFGVNDLSQQELQNRAGVLTGIAANSGFALIALSKGKVRLAVFGVVVPLVAVVASPAAGPSRLPVGQTLLPFKRHRARAKALLRAYRHDRRWSRPARAIQDWVGGKPDPPEPLRRGS